MPTFTPDQIANSPYGYLPTEWVTIVFVSLFGIATLIHLGLALHYRLWWLIITVVAAGTGEVIGWAGRLWSTQNIDAFDPYLMQITTTIISPTPLLAANFIILGALIRYLGPQYSRLSAKWYSIVFLSADSVALVIQAIGGATASSAFQDGNDPTPGGNIMLGGIIIQMVAITVYSVLAAEFLWRFHKKDAIKGRTASGTMHLEIVPYKNVKYMLLGLTLSTIFIFVRSIYRTIELADGWTGPIIKNEALFTLADGLMIVFAMFTIIIFHPAVLLLPILKPSKAPSQQVTLQLRKLANEDDEEAGPKKERGSTAKEIAV